MINLTDIPMISDICLLMGGLALILGGVILVAHFVFHKDFKYTRYKRGYLFLVSGILFIICSLRISAEREAPKAAPASNPPTIEQKEQ